jgi:hypothetical protein
MSKIKLSKGYEAIVDAEDLPVLTKHKWHVMISADKSQVYARRSVYMGNGRTLKVYMHRQLALAERHEQVDHINGITLDNRKKNLRKCTQAENTYNTKRRTNNTSGYKGIYKKKYSSGRQVYCSSIQYNGKSIHIGTFDKIDDAIKAYDKKAKELFGKFAKTNK